jgi:thioredoxin 1
MSVQLATDTDFRQLLDSNERVVVKYYADWCGSCKLFSPKYKRLAADEANAAAVFLDVNAEENEQARKTAGVDNLPFFATYYKGELLEGSATSKEENVKAMIERLLAKN